MNPPMSHPKGHAELMASTRLLNATSGNDRNRTGQLCTFPTLASTSHRTTGLLELLYHRNSLHCRPGFTRRLLRVRHKDSGYHLPFLELNTGSPRRVGQDTVSLWLVRPQDSALRHNIPQSDITIITFQHHHDNHYTPPR